MLTTGTCCSLDTLTVAADIAVGNVIFVASETSPASPTEVVSVERVLRVGRFNAHTLYGNVVVNGVVSSHFTTETGWGVSTRSYAPLWYQLVDLASVVVGAEDDSKKVEAAPLAAPGATLRRA